MPIFSYLSETRIKIHLVKPRSLNIEELLCNNYNRDGHIWGLEMRLRIVVFYFTKILQQSLHKKPSGIEISWDTSRTKNRKKFRLFIFTSCSITIYQRHNPLWNPGDPAGGAHEKRFQYYLLFFFFVKLTFLRFFVLECWWWWVACSQIRKFLKD